LGFCPGGGSRPHINCKCCDNNEESHIAYHCSTCLTDAVRSNGSGSRQNSFMMFASRTGNSLLRKMNDDFADAFFAPCITDSRSNKDRQLYKITYYLRGSDKGGGKCFCPCSFVCLSVSKITQKRVHGFGWNVACRQMSGHGTNWLTFEPDLDYSPDADTGLLSPISYKQR